MIEGSFASDTHTPIVIDERVVHSGPETVQSVFSQTLSNDKIDISVVTKPADTEWFFNTTVAIVVNAQSHEQTMGARMLDNFMYQIFSELTEDVVRADVVGFLAILSRQLNRDINDLWKDHFKSVKKPGLLSLAKSVPELTKLIDYQKVQFSVRPLDMKYAFTAEKITQRAMCTTITQMAERLETLESSVLRPSDDSRCVETIVEKAIEPLLNAAAKNAMSTGPVQDSRPFLKATRKKTSVPTPPPSTTASNPILISDTSAKPVSFSTAAGAWSTVKPKSQRPRSATVTGTTGEYIGRKTDRCLKIQVGESFSQKKVTEAVIQATGSSEDKITVEPLNASSRNYAMSYRIRVQALRVDLNLLNPELWPSFLSS